MTILEMSTGSGLGAQGHGYMENRPAAADS
jgi:hypothetical protein